MSFAVSMLPEAEAEQVDAYNYYEEIKTGLGDEFLEEVIACFKKLANNPQYYSFANNSGRLRDMNVKRFPFLIVFMISGNAVVVVSIRNTARKPFE